MEWGIVGEFILFLAGCLGICAYLEKNIAKSERRMEKSIDGLEQRMEKSIDELKQEVKPVTSFLIKMGMKSVAADIANKSIGGKPAEANSPTTLNPKGQDIAKYLRAEPIVEKYAGKISIPDDADQLAIQSICFTFAFDSLMKVVDKEEAKIIRDTIYREGGEDKSIDIFVVFGILFRNHHLKERGFPVPEYIKPSEAISQ